MPKKILIINIFGIGDVLFTYPMIRNIKKYDSNIQIGYLCNIRTVSMLQKNTDIDKLFVYEKDQYKEISRTSPAKGLKYLVNLFNQIKVENYDMVFDISLNYYFSLFCFLLGIKQRIGLDYKKRSLFLNKKIPFYSYEGKHVVEYYLDLLRVVGIPIADPYMHLFLSEDEVKWAEQFLKDQGIKQSSFLMGLVPGGGASWGRKAQWKRWPKESYAKLADKLIEKYSAHIILLGGKEDESLCADVQGLMKNQSYSACGQSTILQFAALAKKCNLVIANDGGPLHVASASGAKTISIFGPVDEKVYGPYTKEKQLVVINKVPCRPCYRRFRKADCSHLKCLADISVEDVFHQISECIDRN